MPGYSILPIHLDPVDLQEAEKTIDSPITIDLEGVPLRVTIRLALEQLGLEYRVRDGLLAIICMDMEGALNPITELRDKADRGELSQEEANELTQMLETLIKVKKLEVELQQLETQNENLRHREQFQAAKMRESPKPVGNPQ